MFRDIRWRIAIPYIVLILVVMVGLTIYLSRTTRDAQLEGLETGLLAEARAVAESAKPFLASPTEEGLDDLARQWSDILQARVTIIGLDGTVLGESDEDRTQMDNHLNRPEIQQALESGAGISIRYSRTIGRDMMYGAAPIELNGQTVAIARVALPLQQIEANIGRLQRVILTTALLAAAAAVVVAVIIAGRTARSIHRLTQVARRMAAGDLDARLYLAPRDDLGDLTQTFNYMADQLRDRVTDLADEQGRLAAILENMADGMLITDWMGRVTLINPAAVRLLGVDEGEAIGRSFAEVVRHHELIEAWQFGCEKGQENEAAVELARQGPFIRMIVSPLETVGQQSCLVILQDLTRIRRLETVRRDFISNISHELRTPLASLKALVETLRDTALDDPPAAKHFLDLADTEVDALTQMVEELLELTRIESGMVPLRLSLTAVEDIIYPPVDRLRHQAERHHQTLVVDLPGGLPQVLSDAPRAQQVVGNLVHNAIKFTPDRGEISVRAKVGEDGAAVTFSVKDNGVGIPAGELPRIFERFYKADRARSSGGTGLGLAIARHLVQAHGGRIWAKSTEGKGSTFYFTLPVASEGTQGGEEVELADTGG